MHMAIRMNVCPRIRSTGSTSTTRNVSAGILSVIVWLILLIPEATHARSDIRDSMVKIYAVQIEPYYYDPWSMNRPVTTSGSGCIIEGNRILTNAHIVSDQSFVQVRRHGDAKKIYCPGSGCFTCSRFGTVGGGG